MLPSFTEKSLSAKKVVDGRSIGPTEEDESRVATPSLSTSTGGVDEDHGRHSSRGVTLRWKRVGYAVSSHLSCLSSSSEQGKNKVILDDISGSAAPGEVVALLGPSGSGKTSLLDLLANRVARKKGRTIKGKITYNGVPVRQVDQVGMMPHISSYLTQEDALQENFSCIETIRHAASLYLNTSAEEREKVVHEVLDDCGLRDCADTRVGGFFKKGLSGGQKRRLSIAFELIKQSPVMLLDEPTSGIDSAAAKAIIGLLRRLAKKRRLTIILSVHQVSKEKEEEVGIKYHRSIFDLSYLVVAHCSSFLLLPSMISLSIPTLPHHPSPRSLPLVITQPSLEIFLSFDRIMLLARGRTVFFGPPEKTATFYATQGFPVPPKVSPPDFFLETISCDFDSTLEKNVTQLADRWAEEEMRSSGRTVTAIDEECTCYGYEGNNGLDKEEESEERDSRLDSSESTMPTNHTINVTQKTVGEGEGKFVKSTIIQGCPFPFSCHKHVHSMTEKLGSLRALYHPRSHVPAPRKLWIQWKRLLTAILRSVDIGVYVAGSLIIVGIICVFYPLVAQPPFTVDKVMSTFICGAMTIFLLQTNLLSIMPYLIEQRMIFVKERANGFYIINFILLRFSTFPPSIIVTLSIIRLRGLFFFVSSLICVRKHGRGY